MNGAAAQSFKYGAAFNRYDALKLLGLAAMLADHTGSYFFPDQTWFRVMGRIAPVLFLFPIGYAQTKTIPASLVFCALALIGVDALTFSPIFQTNILVTIIACRLFLRWLEGQKTLHPLRLYLVCLLLYPLTFFLFDYGSFGLLFVLCGYYHREQARGGKYFLPLVLLTYFALGLWTFNMNTAQSFIYLGEILLLYTLLANFAVSPLAFSVSGKTERLLGRLARHSLWIYTLHLAGFKFTAWWLFPAEHAEFLWFPVK